MLVLDLIPTGCAAFGAQTARLSRGAGRGEGVGAGGRRYTAGAFPGGATISKEFLAGFV